MPADLVELAGWIAEQYCSTPARALSLVLPPGAAAGRTERPSPSSSPSSPTAGAGALLGEERLTERQREALAQLQQERTSRWPPRSGTATLRRLEARGLVALRSLERAPRPDGGGSWAAVSTAPRR